MAARRSISPGSILRQISLPGVKTLEIRLSPKHAYAATSSHITERDNHPMHRRLLARYQERTDALWWYTITPNKTSGAKTVRAWCARRLRNVFVEALRKQGYDSAGYALSDARTAPLVGSVQLNSLQPMLTTGFADVQAEADNAVGRMIERLLDGQTSVKKVPSGTHDRAQEGKQKSGSASNRGPLIRRT